MIYEKEDEFLVVSTSSRTIKKVLLSDTAKSLLKKSTNINNVEELIEEYEDKTTAYNTLKSLEKISIGRLFDKEYEGKFKKQVEYIDEFVNDYEQSMLLQEKIENVIIESLSELGIDMPMPAMSGSEAKSFLISLLDSDFRDNDYFSTSETASIHKALIDLVNARNHSEVNFHKKHMFY